MVKKLIMLIGLPRSGKSTYARKQNLPMVNPDSIRLALHGQPFIENTEPLVWCMAKYFVKSLFIAGHDMVILDATNLTKKRRDFWKDDGWVCDQIYFNASKEVCIKRAFADDRLDLVPIIEKMDKEKEIELMEINGVIE